MTNVKFLSLLVFSLAFSPAWALKTKFDPTIWEREFTEIGWADVSGIKSELGLENGRAQSVIARHVITTGKEKANDESLILDIQTLEQLKPHAKAFDIIKNGDQIALTDEQVNSIMRLLQMKAENAPAWLKDKDKKKYIQIVLQKNEINNCKSSALSTKDAQALVNWAVKNNRLYKEDHQ